MSEDLKERDAIIDKIQEFKDSKLYWAALQIAMAHEIVESTVREGYGMNRNHSEESLRELCANLCGSSSDMVLSNVYRELKNITINEGRMKVDSSDAGKNFKITSLEVESDGGVIETELTLGEVK